MNINPTASSTSAYAGASSAGASQGADETDKANAKMKETAEKIVQLSMDMHSSAAGASKGLLVNVSA